MSKLLYILLVTLWTPSQGAEAIEMGNAYSTYAACEAGAIEHFENITDQETAKMVSAKLMAPVCIAVPEAAIPKQHRPQGEMS